MKYDSDTINNAAAQCSRISSNLNIAFVLFHYDNAQLACDSRIGSAIDDLRATAKTLGFDMVERKISCDHDFETYINQRTHEYDYTCKKCGKSNHD